MARIEELDKHKLRVDNVIYDKEFDEWLKMKCEVDGYDFTLNIKKEPVEF